MIYDNSMCYPHFTEKPDVQSGTSGFFLSYKVIVLNMEG